MRLGRGWVCSLLFFQLIGMDMVQKFQQFQRNQYVNNIPKMSNYKILHMDKWAYHLCASGRTHNLPEKPSVPYVFHDQILDLAY